METSELGPARHVKPGHLSGLGEDLTDLVHKFKSGVKLSIKGDPVYPFWGLCDAVVGKFSTGRVSLILQLDMADSEVEANIAAVIKAACAHRNPALGPFINRALLMTIPGEEHYALNIDLIISSSARLAILVASLMTIGVCPANGLHYQPKSPVTHEMMISRGSMTAASCITAEAYGNGGVSKELAMTLDNGLDFFFTSVFEPTPNETMQTVTARTTVAPLNTALPVLKRRSIQGSNFDVITLRDEEPGPPAKRALLPVQRS
ncbi:unnamed protein product [Cylicocyclus nassatus]|uniref:Uncharacterized protein n=1 Tax=Cylicocyclus nassatus TaxID=53992 RepID=A0AA36DL68_CYLNA|nr:unnamed protein product [Cylicocyclus nassatus]